jgi:glycerol-3-phosphate O-acyltransferase
MSEGVAIPAWLLVVMAALAVWALYEHVLLPTLRFLVTHPANRVIDELGERLRIGIRPFQRTRRQALIHSLLADRRVQAAAEQYARDKGLSLPAALRRVERYAREIVPAFNAYLYFRIGYWIGRWIARSLYRVRLGYIDSEGIAKVGRDATVVFVMTHRSNMDDVLAA